MASRNDDVSCEGRSGTSYENEVVMEVVLPADLALAVALAMDNKSNQIKSTKGTENEKVKRK